MTTHNIGLMFVCTFAESTDHIRFGKRESLRSVKGKESDLSAKIAFSGSTAGAAVVPLQPGAVPQLPSSTTSSGSTAGATARGTAGQVLATGMRFGT